MSGDHGALDRPRIESRRDPDAFRIVPVGDHYAAMRDSSVIGVVERNADGDWQWSRLGGRAEMFATAADALEQALRGGLNYVPPVTRWPA